jgi:hypothetical protein
MNSAGIRSGKFVTDSRGIMSEYHINPSVSHLRDFLALKKLMLQRRDNPSLERYAMEEFKKAFQDVVWFDENSILKTPKARIIKEGVNVEYSRIHLLPSERNCSGYSPNMNITFLEGNRKMRVETVLRRYDCGLPCLLGVLEDAFRIFNVAFSLDRSGIHNQEPMPLRGAPDGSIYQIKADKRGSSLYVAPSGMFKEAVARLVRLYEAIGFEKIKSLGDLKIRASEREPGAREKYVECLRYATPIKI